MKTALPIAIIAAFALSCSSFYDFHKRSEPQEPEKVEKTVAKSDTTNFTIPIGTIEPARRILYQNPQGEIAFQPLDSTYQPFSVVEIKAYDNLEDEVECPESMPGYKVSLNHDLPENIIEVEASDSADSIDTIADEAINNALTYTIGYDYSEPFDIYTDPCIFFEGYNILRTEVVLTVPDEECQGCDSLEVRDGEPRLFSDWQPGDMKKIIYTGTTLFSQEEYSRSECCKMMEDFNYYPAMRISFVVYDPANKRVLIFAHEGEPEGSWGNIKSMYR